MKLKKFIKDTNKTPLKLEELAVKIQDVDDAEAVELQHAANAFIMYKERLLYLAQQKKITITT